MLKTVVRVVFLLSVRRTGASAATRQGQVCVEGVFFLRDAEVHQRAIYGSRQRSELRSTLNANPQHSWRACAGEEAVAAKIYLEGFGDNCFQRLLDFHNAFFRSFTNELERDVQRFRPRPAHVRSKFTHAVEKAGNARPTAIVDVES